MSTTDLYMDGFPHGKPEGYEKGCRGSACPNQQGPDLTCRAAHVKYQGDYAYRKAIDAGVEWVEPVVVKPTPRATAAVKPTPLPAAEPAAKPKPVAPAAPKAESKPRVKLLPTDEGFPHGTPNGYARGCKTPKECPAAESCKAASAAYQRDWRENKLKKDASAADAILATPAADAPPVVVPAASAAVPKPRADFPLASQSGQVLATLVMDAGAELRASKAAGVLLRAENKSLKDQVAEYQAKLKQAFVDAAATLSPVLDAEAVEDPSVRFDPTSIGGAVLTFTGNPGPMHLLVKFDVHGLAEARVTTGIAQAAA